jgi:ubiquinone/menaquinone biosynthesis C-methylase UbiE
VGLDRSSSAAFAKVAESYERRRPSYTPELVAWVVARAGIRPGTTVVDVAAGTGKLTRQLVPTGARVVAVEPLAEMRAQLEAVVPGVEVLEGTAEALPLPDAEADAITVASAMHWFDLGHALPEFHRVLKPGGRLAVVGQGRDLSDPLQAEIQEILGRFVPGHSAFLGWRDELDASPLFGPRETVESTHEQLFDPEGLAERIGTISYVARLPDDQRSELLAGVRALGEAQPRTPIPFRYRASASVCTRRDDL